MGAGPAWHPQCSAFAASLHAGQFFLPAWWLKEAAGPFWLSNSSFVNTNEGSNCDEKEEEVPEKAILTKNFTLKEVSRVFHDIEGRKDEIR